MATVTRERELLRELVALVRGECPSLLNEDSGGDVRLSMAIDDALAAPPAEDEDGPFRKACARIRAEMGWKRNPREIDDLVLEALRPTIPVEAFAQAPPASAPPGLVALVAEWKRLRKAVDDADNGRKGPPWSLIEECKAAGDRVFAYPLPASPRAETTKGDE